MTRARALLRRRFGRVVAGCGGVHHGPPRGLARVLPGRARGQHGGAGRPHGRGLCGRKEAAHERRVPLDHPTRGPRAPPRHPRAGDERVPAGFIDGCLAHLRGIHTLNMSGMQGDHRRGPCAPLRMDARGGLPTTSLNNSACGIQCACFRAMRFHDLYFFTINSTCERPFSSSWATASRSRKSE